MLISALCPPSPHPKKIIITFLEIQTANKFLLFEFLTDYKRCLIYQFIEAKEPPRSLRFQYQGKR